MRLFIDTNKRNTVILRLSSEKGSFFNNPNEGPGFFKMIDQIEELLIITTGNFARKSVPSAIPEIRNFF